MVNVRPVVRPSITESVEDYIKIVIEQQPATKVKGTRMLLQQKSMNCCLDKIEEEEEDLTEPNETQ